MTNLGILPVDAVLQHQVDERGHIVRLRLLVPQRVEKHQPQLVPRLNCRIRDEGLHALHQRPASRNGAQKEPPVWTYPEIRSGPSRQPLLDLTNVQELIPLYQPAELSHERDVLAHVPTELVDFGVFFDEALHVADRVDRLGVVRKGVRLVGLDVGLEGGAEVAERRGAVCFGEGVGGGGESHFLVNAREYGPARAYILCLPSALVVYPAPS